MQRLSHSVVDARHIRVDGREADAALLQLAQQHAGRHFDAHEARDGAIKRLGQGALSARDLDDHFEALRVHGEARALLRD